MKIKNVLIMMAAMTVGTSALALPPDGGDPPPPPPKLNDCSPGFWKNHQEWWTTQLCNDDQGCVDSVMANLTAQGKGSGDIRQSQADFLNAWADGEYKTLICID